MTSNFHIQKPYVLASLPRSLAQVDGKSVVGEVYGQRPGVKKRRRAEVVVGIDGESANIYDIASSRLITSYPIPPQAKFSCVPCSIRLRSSSSRDATVARYTYIATREPARKLSLFKDTVEGAGATASESVTASLGRTGDIVALHTLSLPEKKADAPASSVAVDLLAVYSDGQVTCYDGETLKEKYKASVASLSQDPVPRGSNVRVDFVQMGLASDVVKGLGLGDYLSGIFSQTIDSEGGFNPDILFVITTVTGGQVGNGAARYLHILSADSERDVLLQAHYIRLPTPTPDETTDDVVLSQPTYRLDVLSGSLSALEGESILSYDLTRSVPRVVSSIAIPGVTSFLRLSKSSILAATATSFSVYNPLFKSLQASTALDVQASVKSSRGEAPKSDSNGSRACSFVSFFPQLELAVALLDSNLVTVQLEPPRTRSKKRRADGLLIDSVGRGSSLVDARTSAESAPLPKKYLPGTMSASYLAQFNEDAKSADALLAEQDIPGFDDLLAERLGIQSLSDWRWQRPLDAPAVVDAMDETQDGDEGNAATNGLPNGTTNGLTNGLTNGNTTNVRTTTPPPPSSSTHRGKYPLADRRWVVYAISRIFTVKEEQAGGRLRLRCKVPSSDILNYLVDAGHLSVANTRSALRESLRDVDDDDQLLGESLPAVLAHVDPSLDLLLRWLYETKLGATELLSATLLLMRSLELVDKPAEQPKLLEGTLLRSGDAAAEGEGEADAEYSGDKTAPPEQLELDELDQQLHLAEYFLQHVENDPRDLALDIAIGKLGSCPAMATVQGLRRIFRTDEIRALIEVLRKQMVDQGWATRYMDMDVDEPSTTNPNGAASGAAAAAADTTPLNYSIRLIADLLCRCIDAVRPGEWLINDEEVAASAAAAAAAAAAASNDDAPSFAGSEAAAGGDFFALLKWQVSAALEGVQEALYLRGLVGEAVRYGMGVEKIASKAAHLAKNSQGDEAKARPQTVAAPAAASVVSGLPLGLRAPTGLPRHTDVTATKVVYGGEIVKRTKREIGHLTSKKVGAYTLERIVF
ncbi:hypothetical protein SPBR_04618 [Sporothrix brasiliensis 5110]|uniref:Utp8 beta-propeller domain-containing protein n=1 Tax=Sporothrix brasiliensis 5110 TaxID=1398154 RepID=A0A0C2ILC8_9PEZI|nr:uncharacterized protein SPBR_04618 [Sporothrix brasiliensis 5110]KIH87790.1 hypothetical protein SPBR_04618 [Sporothrix brasiliensis 5110]